MDFPIGGVLITNHIIFMMECTWSMILEMDKNHGRQSLSKKRSRRNTENSNTSITPQGTSNKRKIRLSDKIQDSMKTDLKISKDEVDHLMTAYNSYF